MSSFADIANEKEDTIIKSLNFDLLPLPDKEAPPMDFSRPSSSDDSSGSDTAQDDSGFDMEAFLGGLTSDISSNNLDEPPSIDDLFDNIDMPSEENTPPGDIPDDIAGIEEQETQVDFGAADDILGDLGTTDFNGSNDTSFETPSDEISPDGFGDFDLSGLDSTDTGVLDESPEESDSPNLDAVEDVHDESNSIDLGGETYDTSAGSDFDLGDFDMPVSEPDAETADETADSGLGDFAAAGFNISDDVSGESNAIDLGGESLGGDEMPDFASDETSPGMGTGDDFEMPAVQDTADFGSDDLDSGIDMGGESLDFEDSGFDAEPLGDDFSGSDFGGGFESPLPDFESDLPDLGGDLPDFDLGETDASGGDFEMPADDSGSEAGSVDFGSDFDSSSIDLDTEQEEPVSEVVQSGSLSGAFGDDDFHIPGLEEIFEKSKTAAVTAPAPKKGLFRRRKPAAAEEFKADDDIEEIRLSQDELDNLLETMSTFPLNLRVACEELIVEKVLLPKQLSHLIYLLKTGAGIRETAAYAEELLGKPIIIPRGFEKMTGASFEAEKSSFAYIFMHNFLPVLRLFAVIAALAGSVFYLGYRFIYTPIRAESVYKRGYERIPAGEYQRANQLFDEAFNLKPKIKWFYLYAEAFRDERRYLLAEEKYDDLLRHYPMDKKGVLDYAFLETYYLLNYDKSNRLLQQLLLDFAPADYDGLLAAGDNFLLWGDSDPERFYDKYEDARFSYARVIDNYGQSAPVMERMMKYFIRTDNLKEVLNCRAWFENNRKAVLSAPSLAELGGYLLDKQLEEVKGVPDAYVQSIESVREMLLDAVRADLELPEPHYHLARYYHWLGNTYDERLTLENAIRAFDIARTETVQRRKYRVDAHFRYANLLVNNREFFPAEEQVIRGIQLYEDFLSRNLLSASPQLGQLYAAKGDLEYFVKAGDMNSALNDYRLAETYGYSPPEIQYRMGAAYYQLRDWRNSLEYLVKASADLPLNRRLLYALGNASYQRGDYFAAQGYYTRLLDILESQRIRMPVLLPNDNPQFLELGERIMMAMNNTGVVYEKLADLTTNRNLRSTAIAYYAESARAWDSITRNPETMTRMILTGSPGTPGINLGYLNANNAMRPVSEYDPEIFVRIDRDVLEPSRWEELAPSSGGLQ